MRIQEVDTHVASSRFRFTGLAALWLTGTAGFGQPLPPDGAKPEGGASGVFSMDLDALSNIKVTTASKFAEKLSDAPSDRPVVTRDELRRFGGITLLEIVERVAGLTGSSRRC
jgi:outer membrane receptor protein involved in Fe transport